VRARLAPDPYVWPWSSARAHSVGKDDILVKVEPLLKLVGDWKQFLTDANEGDVAKIRSHERTGRALGGDTFLDTLENSIQRIIRPRKAGRKKLADK